MLYESDLHLSQNETLELLSGTEKTKDLIYLKNYQHFMNSENKEILWSQFGASIDMLTNAISIVSDEYLLNHHRYYHLAYHSIIFLDYYVTVPPTDFKPELPFDVIQEENTKLESIGNLTPSRIFSKTELLESIQKSRIKARNLIEQLPNESGAFRFIEDDQTDGMDYSVLEIILYNMRHIQHHVGQLHILLRQDCDLHAEWVFQTDEKL